MLLLPAKNPFIFSVGGVNVYDKLSLKKKEIENTGNNFCCHDRCKQNL